MAEIELSVDEGHPAVAEKFFRAGFDLMTLLDEFAEIPTEWIITELRIGSAVARIGSPANDAQSERPLHAVVAGLSRVASDEPLPREWSPDAVAAARRLALVAVNPENDELGRLPATLSVVVGGRRVSTVQLTDELACRLDDLQPFERAMPGAVRGQLVGVNISRGNRASIRRSSGSVIRVNFSNELRLAMKEALLLDVELTGVVRQDSDGRIFHVRAEDVRVLPTPNLTWSELFGADPGITGGLTVEAFLEETRGEA